MTFKLGALIGVGGTAEVFEMEDHKVVKLFFASYDEDVVRFEYDKTKKALELGLPVPSLYEFVSIDGRYGFVMEKIEGTSVLNELFTLMMSHRDDEIVAEIKASANLLYHIHQCHADLEDTVQQTLKNALISTPLLTQTEKEMIENLIDSLPTGDVICHGDPNPSNMIKTAHNYVFIDWVNAVSGHPLYDLAQYICIFKHIELPSSTPPEVISVIEKTSDVVINIFLSEYLRLAGWESIDLSAWLIPIYVTILTGSNSQQRKEKILIEIRKELTALNGREECL